LATHSRPSLRGKFHRKDAALTEAGDAVSAVPIPGLVGARSPRPAGSDTRTKMSALLFTACQNSL